MLSKRIANKDKAFHGILQFLAHVFKNGTGFRKISVLAWVSKELEKKIR